MFKGESTDKESEGDWSVSDCHREKSEEATQPRAIDVVRAIGRATLAGEGSGKVRECWHN